MGIQVIIDNPGQGEWTYGGEQVSATDPGTATWKNNAADTRIDISVASISTMSSRTLLVEFENGAHVYVRKDGKDRVYSVQSVVDNTTWFSLTVTAESTATGFSITSGDVTSIDLIKPKGTGGGGGVTDHGALTGLSDDDHAAIYLDLTRHNAVGGNPHGVTKSQVALGSVDNTSDLGKPISTATQTALDTKLSETTHDALPSDNPHGVVAADVGLGNADNTADVDKPVSTATQTALDGKSATGHGHTLADVSDSGTAAALNVGTALTNIPQLEDVGGGTPGMPAVDGSQLTGLPAPGSPITVTDEGGTPLTTDVVSFDFVGAGVTATTVGDDVTITVGGGAAPVASVFGRFGPVVAEANDYTASEVDNDSDVGGTFVHDALNALKGHVDAVTGNPHDVSLDDTINAGTPDNNVAVPVSSPVILTDGGFATHTQVRVDKTNSILADGHATPGLQVEHDKQQGGLDVIEIASGARTTVSPAGITFDGSGVVTGGAYVIGPHQPSTADTEGKRLEISGGVSTGTATGGILSLEGGRAAGSGNDGALQLGTGNTASITIGDSVASVLVSGDPIITGDLTVVGLLQPHSANHFQGGQDELVAQNTSSSSELVDRFMKTDGAGGWVMDDIAAAGGVDVEEDGTPKVTAADTINFTGTPITVTDVGGVATVNVTAGTAPVDSVFGRFNAVVAVASDYDASQVDNDSGVTGAFVDDALNTLDTDIGTVSTAAGLNTTHRTSSGVDHADVVTNNTHRGLTNNPHATDVGNLGTGTLTELNAALTVGVLIDTTDSRLSDDRNPIGHQQPFTTIELIPTDRILGRDDAGTGTAEALTATEVNTLLGTGAHMSDVTTNPHDVSLDNLLSGTLAQLNVAVADATIDDVSGPRDADNLLSATTTIDIASSAAPALNWVLTATSGTAATWQPQTGGPATELETTGAAVNVDLAAPPSTNQVLKATSATTAIWDTVAGTGDVVGPGPTVTDNAVARFDLTGGFLIQESPVIVNDTGTISGVENITLSGTVDGIDVATDVAANTAKVTNATHTGDVTGATALTIGTDKVLTTHILNSNVTNAKLANMAANTVKSNATAGAAAPADLAVGTNVVVGRVAGNIVAAQLATGQITDDAVTLGKMNAGTAGNIITYDASGNPAAVATSATVGHVLKSAGTGAAPTFGSLIAASFADNTIAPARIETQSDSGAYIFNATGVPAFLGPGAVGEVLTSGGTGVIPSWDAPAGGSASALDTTGASVNVGAAAPPTTGEILRATSATTSDWTTLTAASFADDTIAVGRLADGTDGELITWSAAGVATTVPVGTAAQVLTSGGVGVAPTFQDRVILSKTITVEDPVTAEDITIFFTPVAITITEIRAVIRGSTPSVLWFVKHATATSGRNSAGAAVVTAGTTTTSQTTGSDVTSFNDSTIAADSFVWLETETVSGTNDELSITIMYTED